MHSLFVIGDSITLDYGPHLEAALEGVASVSRKEGRGEAYKNLDLPRGANGGHSGMVREYLGYLNAGGVFHTDVMLINCGLHDIKSNLETGELQVSTEAYRENLVAIMDLAPDLARKVAWVRTTPIDDERHAKRRCGFGRVQRDVDRYNQIADEVMKEKGIQIIPFDEATHEMGTRMDLYRDGVHFLKPVHKEQGEYLAGEVRGLLLEVTTV